MATPIRTSQSPPVPGATAENSKSSFELAAERARARFPLDVWPLLEPARQSNAIYAELRLIDAEATRARTARG